MTTDLVSVWPQQSVRVDCLVTIAMDVTAPFLGDVGLGADIHARLRSVTRLKIDESPGILTHEVDHNDWLLHFDDTLLDVLSPDGRIQFWTWVRDTYTLAPADRPNWGRYEMFFFQWAVAMRDGVDNAVCFTDASDVYDAYRAFVSSRNVKARIKQCEGRKLSSWDQRMYSARSYSLAEEDLLSGEYGDPFGTVKATAPLNFFQQFWEYLQPILPPQERQQLYDAMCSYYCGTSDLTALVPPDQLTRRIR